MIKIALRFSVLAFVLACSLPADANGPSYETWVSHTGSDTNVCNTPSSPCKTLTGALGQTSTGGQINVMDSGDFSSVIITQSVSQYRERNLGYSHEYRRIPNYYGPAAHRQYDNRRRG